MSLWLRLSRADIVATLIILALVAGFTWFRWAALPDPDQSTDTAEATVESITYAVPRGRSGAQASVSIMLRPDDGTEVSVGRKTRCLPAVNRGDRVRLIGSRDRAGRRIWSIAGEPCAEEIY
jgi:hypothetical protein